MTYAIVTAILILALIAVVVAVVVDTDNRHEPESAESNGRRLQMTDDDQAEIDLATREAHAYEGGIVDVPEEVDRNTGPVRL